MKPLNNTFSFRRVYDLTRMNFSTRWNWKHLCLYFLFSLVYLLMDPLISDYNDGSGEVYNLLAKLPIVAILYFLLFMETISRRMHESDTVAFVSIPATYFEKFVSVFVTAFLLFIQIWLVLQVMLLITGLATPEWIPHYERALGPGAYMVGKVLLVNPFEAILPLNPVIWGFILISIFSATLTRWWYIGMGVAFVLIITLTYIDWRFLGVWIEYADVEGPAYQYNPIFIFLWVINLGLLIGTYFNLKKLQQTR